MPAAVRVPVRSCQCPRPTIDPQLGVCFWCGHEPMGRARWLEVLPVVAMSATEIVWRTRPGACVRCGKPLDELTIGPLGRYCGKTCRQAASKQRA